MLFAFFMMIMCVFILGGNTSPVYATEEIQNKKLINSVHNIEVSEINTMLDRTTLFTSENVAEIERYSNVSFKILDDYNAEMIITNKIPEKVNFYNDGTKEEFYTTNKYIGTYQVIPGNRESYPTTFFAKFKIRADFSEYKVGPAQVSHYRLITGSGAVLDCFENGFRNLIVTPRVVGAYENPDGTVGTSKKLTYPMTIASPQLGTLYSKNTGNSNYYNSAGGAIVAVDVDVEFRHGSGSWGNWTGAYLVICE